MDRKERQKWNRQAMPNLLLGIVVMVFAIGITVAGHYTKLAKPDEGYAAIGRILGTDDIVVEGSFIPLLARNGIAMMECRQKHALADAPITLVHIVRTSGTETKDWRPSEETKKLCRALYTEARRHEDADYRR